MRRGQRFAQMRPGSDGIYRSKVFPGLWLDAAALFAENLDRLIEVLEQGSGHIRARGVRGEAGRGWRGEEDFMSTAHAPA